MYGRVIRCFQDRGYGFILDGLQAVPEREERL